MSREEIEKLLGGHATGTLTPEEREALFAAALEDQQLFEELAREEPLRELLQDPVAKTRLQAVLERRPEPVRLRWLRGAAWAIPAFGLAAVVVVFVVQQFHPLRPVMIAQAPALPRMGPVEPVPSALPKNLEKRQLPLVAQALRAVPIDSLANSAPPAAPSAKDAKEPVAAPAAVRDQAVTATPPPAPVAAPVPVPPAPRQVAPAPLNPPAAAQQVVVVAGQPQFGQLSQQGLQSQQSQQGQQGQQYAGGQRFGPAAETVQVRAGAVGGLVAQQDARALFFGQSIGAFVQTNLVDVEQQARRKALSAAAPAVQREAGATAARQIGLRYSVQRRLANGQTAAVIPNEVLEAGDQVTLNLEANEAGYLSVFARTAGVWRELSSARVERLVSYTVPQPGSLAFDASGTIDLFVLFSREARPSPYPVPEARLDQVMSANFQERVTYVVSTATPAQGQVVAFPITLTHK